jgi:hypothetical protein
MKTLEDNPMSELEMLNPANWKPAKGYANGIAATGRTVFLGGQIGWTGDQVFETDDFVAQVRQVLENIRDILAEAGGTPDRIVRMTWFITDKREYLANLPGDDHGPGGGADRGPRQGRDRGDGRAVTALAQAFAPAATLRAARQPASKRP